MPRGGSARRHRGVKRARERAKKRRPPAYTLSPQAMAKKVRYFQQLSPAQQEAYYAQVQAAPYAANDKFALLELLRKHKHPEAWLGKKRKRKK